MARALGSIVLFLVLGGIAALFVHEGVYKTHVVEGSTVVVLNRFTGQAFQIRNGLKEPVEPSTLENRIAKYFDTLRQSTPAVPVQNIEVKIPRKSTDEDPFAGIRHNPDFTVLSPASQFQYLKRYAEYMLQPSRSARLPRPDREAMLKRMLQGLFAHPHAQILTESEKNELKKYYQDMTAGKN